MTTPQREPDGLDPVLRQVEAELSHHLQEACEAEASDLREETTGELLKLEESLFAAAKAAEQAVRIRRKMRQQPAGAPPEAVREFTDSEGREWRVWAVVPGRMRSKEQAERYLGDYARGWLAFEALDGSARRRLPNHPDDWRALDDVALERLMRGAPEVPARRREGPEGMPRPDDVA